jgi:uroporphyrinogen-III decarboxylase
VVGALLRPTWAGVTLAGSTLGPEVWIQGGPTVQLLLHGTPEQVTEEVKRILATGVTEGKRFMLREANNLAPGTPLLNLDAFYRAAVTYGRYD